MTLTGRTGTRFVGREREISRLLASADDAAAGRGSVAVVAGEPGIGKTRLVSELSAQLRSDGWLVLSAQCWEESGAPTCWPWTVVLRQCAIAGHERAAGLLPRLRQAERAESRFEVFDEVVALLTSIAEERPVAIVLDDVHVADQPSILLLRMVAAASADIRLLICVTVRDGDSVESGSAASLMRLRRSATTVQLRGLDRASASELVAERTGRPPAGAVLDRLLEVTSGNPFFLGEIGVLMDEATDDLPLPPTVRDAIRRRVSPLADQTQEILGAAAVLGRSFDPVLLARVAGEDEQTVATALRHALEAGLVVTEGVQDRLRFVHALTHACLYDDLSPAARRALHLDAARIVPQTDEELVAFHLLRAVPDALPVEAIDHAVIASDLARRASLFERAAEMLEVARDVAHRFVHDPVVELDLLLRGADMRMCAGHASIAIDAFKRAAGLARQSGDTERFAQAALGATAKVAFQLPDATAPALLTEALEMDVPADIRVRLLAALARTRFYIGDRRAAIAAGEEAVALAREAGDGWLLAEALMASHVAMWGPRTREQRMAAAREAIGLAPDDLVLTLDATMTLLIGQAEIGDIAGFDASLGRYGDLAERSGQPRYRYLTATRRAFRSLLAGRYDEGWTFAGEGLRLGQLAEEPDAEILYVGSLIFAARDTGRSYAAIKATFEDFSRNHTSIASECMTALLAFEDGDPTPAETLFATLAVDSFRSIPDDLDHVLTLCMLAEIARCLQAHAQAETLLELLEPHENQCAIVAGAVAFGGCVPHYLGLLCACLGRSVDAQKWFDRAQTVYEEIGALPWLARVQVASGNTDEGAGLARTLGMDRFVSLAARPVQTPHTQDATFTVRAGMRQISFGGRSFALRDSKGLRHIAALIAQPNQPVHVVDLAGRSSGDAGPVLDADAKRAYTERLAEIRAEIDEARAWNDDGRVVALEGEAALIANELGAALGMGGRDRRLGSEAERARVAVRKAVTAALAALAECDPVIADHLRRSIKTGLTCVYEPDLRQPVRWKL